ncbi:flagellar assembly factor FliW [bacterium BMS3Abin03]|nr:flagellar assembly factor FliW [bacterium BMS3Abin03]
MKINTLQFGKLEYDENQIVKFPEGILGFEELKEYLLIKTDNELFYWLTSVDNPNVAFPLIGIRLIDSEFLEKPDSEAFGIVKLDKDPLNITVNLKAPVYINQEIKEGFQTVLDEDKYPVSYQLFKED